MNEFPVHDDVMLAALDFIDSFDSDSDPPSLPPASPSLKRQRMTSGQRNRAEIERLRLVVAELEARIQERRQTSRSHGEIDSRHDSAWETIASQEKQQRERAQMQNAQLREVLTKQTRMLRKLETLLARGRRLQTTSSVVRQLIAEETESRRHSVVTLGRSAESHRCPPDSSSTD